jgi:hypothetical protein
MKRIFTPLLCLLALLAVHSAQAITLSILPGTQVGNQIAVDLKIEGLGDDEAPSLSVFYVGINFNSMISYNSFIPGDPILGDQLDLGMGSIYLEYLDTPNVVSLYGVSLVSLEEIDQLNNSQAGEFILTRLIFDILDNGFSTF